MNKFFILIDENNDKTYDFTIEYFNELTMNESKIIGIKKNVSDLDECYDMIIDFPITKVNELTSVVLNRYNDEKTTIAESRFSIKMNKLIDQNKLQEFIMN